MLYTDVEVMGEGGFVLQTSVKAGARLPEACGPPERGARDRRWGSVVKEAKPALPTTRRRFRVLNVFWAYNPSG